MCESSRDSRLRGNDGAQQKEQQPTWQTVIEFVGIIVYPVGFL
jgi:hypothetical protein